MTGGKENERVPALPKEVEKEKTSNRAPERRSLGEERLRRFRFVSSIKNEFRKRRNRYIYEPRLIRRRKEGEREGKKKQGEERFLPRKEIKKSKGRGRKEEVKYIG